MPPQYVPVPPYPAAAPPSYPQRWPEATSAPASPRQRWPEAAPAPPPLPPHPPGEPVFVRPESLEDIPRYVRDDEEAEGEAGAEESAGRGGSEGEIVVQETSEDFLEKGVEEEPTVGLRQRLRDFLRRIRERLEQKPVAELEEEPLPVPEPGRQAGLLGYLEELAEYLPEQEKSGFLRSDARLKIEYIKAKLQGKVGVKRRIETGYTPPSPPAPERSSRQGELSMEEIADTFAFIGTLAAHHPDKNLGTMLQSKVKGIVQRIKS
jgi:hypothetical protein